MAALPIGKGSDLVAVDPLHRLMFSANSCGTPWVIVIGDGGRFTVRPSPDTPGGARTIAVDPATGRIFPAAATPDGTIPSARPQAGRHTRFVPGSLQMLRFDPR